jgi:hypothetical protein
MMMNIDWWNNNLASVRRSNPTALSVHASSHLSLVKIRTVGTCILCLYKRRGTNWNENMKKKKKKKKKAGYDYKIK